MSITPRFHLNSVQLGVSTCAPTVYKLNLAKCASQNERFFLITSYSGINKSCTWWTSLYPLKRPLQTTQNLYQVSNLKVRQEGLVSLTAARVCLTPTQFIQPHAVAKLHAAFNGSLFSEPFSLDEELIVEENGYGYYPIDPEMQLWGWPWRKTRQFIFFKKKKAASRSRFFKKFAPHDTTITALSQTYLTFFMPRHKNTSFFFNSTAPGLQDDLESIFEFRCVDECFIEGEVAPDSLSKYRPSFFVAACRFFFFLPRRGTKKKSN